MSYHNLLFYEFYIYLIHYITMSYHIFIILFIVAIIIIVLIVENGFELLLYPGLYDLGWKS
jgi:hypothetical protein